MTERIEMMESEQEVIEAIGYLRVSTEGQAESGLGLEAQKARIEAFCAAKGWNLLDFYSDSGISAKTLVRPALRDAIKFLSPGRVLVAFKLDRFMRTASDLDTFTTSVKKSGGEWATVEGNYDTSTAMGRCVIRLIADIAQMEREQTGERTRAALAAKRERGEFIGGLPLGYKFVVKDGKSAIYQDRTEIQTVRTILGLRFNEGLSFGAIADLMTLTGRKTKRGGKWEAMTIKKVCDRPKAADIPRRTPIDTRLERAMKVLSEA